MQELKDIKSLDIFMYLHDMSQKHYEEKSLVKNESILKEEATNKIFNFFDYLTDADADTRRGIIKYYNLSYFSDEIEGLVFVKNNKVSRLLVPTFNNIYSASIAVHEYTHALNFDSVCNLNTRDAYEEILPFLNQFLFLDFISKEYHSKKVIDSAKYFLIQQELFLNINNFMKLLNQISVDDNIQTKRMYYIKMTEHYRYIIGSLYSLQLYEYFKMDEKMFMNEYKKLYKERKTIEDLLNFYSISLKNKENILLVKNLIKK